MTGETICYVCGRLPDRVELHHVVPGWPVTAPLCVPCHVEQTRGQWANRTLRAAEPPQRMWAAVYGVLALLIARADSQTERDALQLAQRLALRLLCDLSGSALGPNPTRAPVEKVSVG